ncbi:MAG: hypothetical protein OHK0039_14710 [Bacteroidia bacterium]
MEQGFVLNPLDIIIAAIIGFGAYRGAQKGILTKSKNLLAIGAGVLFGLRFRSMAESLYLDYLKLQISPQVLAVLSFATAFVIVYMVVSTGLTYLGQGLDKMPGKALNLNNAIGALAGGFIATFVLSVALVLLGYVSFPSPTHAQGSVLYPRIKGFARYALGMGVGILREANVQINRMGVGTTDPNAVPTPGTTPPPPNPSADRPGAIR